MPSILPAIDSPSQVVVALSTHITISDFATFYPHTSPNSFQPAYASLADGSLVAPPFHHDLAVNNALLLITGCLLSIFLRNASKAAIYLWRGKIKKKGLLYTLFLSQLLGPIAIIPIILAQFNTSVNCAVILRIFFLTSGASLSLLVTGIFGVKSYRCLDNNRLVSAVLVTLRVAGSAVLIFNVIRIHTFRSLSGRCYTSSTALSSVFVILLLIESLFNCACFLYAVQKSHGPVAVRGRISVRLSLDDVTPRQPTEPRKEGAESVRNRNRRGWSDLRLHTNHGPTSSQISPSSPESSIASTPHDGFQGVHSLINAETAQSSKRPIPSPSTMHSLRPAPRSWTAKMPATMDGSHFPESVAAPIKLPTFPAQSPISRFTRYVPRMSLFREVMRDELCYSAITSAFTIVSATMTLVGVKSAGGIDATAWVALDWALISLLVTHSFGRAIRRHENESLLLHPSARYHDLHTDRTTAELLGDVPQPVRTPGMLSRARGRRSVAHHDVDSGAAPLSCPYVVCSPDRPTLRMEIYIP
ncbi:hypothetical protein JVT61DRAFT_5727 [Boletus reticuloceps]|uniref:Uncharacterized protein n=1 Tax=Boletus reticuloceps TaxID=495285 RepID=A0A8I2YXV7_9AGAM|nr:hypothetical protein JVT61DRAFT_5727 [Boletus reticuloceps]